MTTPEPIAVKKKPTYSFSQLETATCGAKYKFKYVDKRTEDKTYNLAAGTICDTAFNAYYEDNRHLVDTHAERMAVSRVTVDLLIDEHPEWLTMKWSQKAGDPRSSVENLICWLYELGALEKICYPERGRVEVQKQLVLELPDYNITGYVDCLHLDTGLVSDIKLVTGWTGVTEPQYALRAQVPLYRMMLYDIFGLKTTGQYELLMARKKPELKIVADPTIDFIQEKLVMDFNAHHAKLESKTFDRNPSKCFDYNRVCTFFGQCWPELAAMVEVESETKK